MIRLLRNILMGIRMCFLELLSNKRRTTITSLGIFLGVTSLLTNMAFLRGMDDDLQQNMIAAGGLNIIRIDRVRAETEEEKLGFGRSEGLSFEEIERISRDFEPIESVLRNASNRWQKVMANSKSTFSRITAVSPEYLDAYNYQIKSGRFFTESEYQGGSAVAIIGGRTALRLYGTESPLGKYLTMGTFRFKVVGLLDAEMGIRGSQFLYPYEFYKKRLAGEIRGRESIEVALTNSDLVDTATAFLNRELFASHRGVKDFEVEANLDKIKEMKTASAALSILLWVIAAMTLLIGCVSIMNIMFATIGNRIREIGVRKAMGARKADILFQFLIEAVIVSIVGAIPGILVATAVTFSPEGIFPYEPRLTPGDYMLALGFIIGAGLMSGLFPAIRAAKMEVVEALRF